jgi:tetratricopeptide (TPR) repeat protein
MLGSNLVQRAVSCSKITGRCGLAKNVSRKSCKTYRVNRNWYGTGRGSDRVLGTSYPLATASGSVSQLMQFSLMRNSFVVAAILLLCARASPQTLPSEQVATKNSTDIRAVLCDMDKGDYTSAEKRLEQLLQSDPKNIYAQKLLASTLAAQIKIGGDSARNATVARKAIEAYQRVSNDPGVSGAEKAQIDKYVLILYRHVGADEQRKEIERRALDSTRSPGDRSELSAVLASLSWDCSYRITSKEAGPEKAELEKAAVCVSKGLDYTNQALTLDRNNESAWSYKASLFKEAAKLAGFGGNQTQKASYLRQADAADKQTMDLGAKRRAEEEEDWARQNEERKKNDSFTPKDAVNAAKELVTFEAETSLDDAVKREFIPNQLELTTLVAPVPIPQEKTEPKATTASPSPQASLPAQKGCFREVDGIAAVQEKRDWKSFSPAEDLMVDLPDNLCARGDSYIAASDGVMYTIHSMDRPPIALKPNVVEGVLNTLARTFVGFRSRGWLDDGLAHSFELRLLRKDDVNDQPRRVYAYALVSCAERRESVLIVQASKAHYYTIDINGANESDARVQRFLKSVKIK